MSPCEHVSVRCVRIMRVLSATTLVCPLVCVRVSGCVIACENVLESIGVLVIVCLRLCECLAVGI